MAHRKFRKGERTISPCIIHSMLEVHDSVRGMAIQMDNVAAPSLPMSSSQPLPLTSGTDLTSEMQGLIDDHDEEPGEDTYAHVGNKNN